MLHYQVAMSWIPLLVCMTYNSIRLVPGSKTVDSFRNMTHKTALYFYPQYRHLSGKCIASVIRYRPFLHVMAHSTSYIKLNWGNGKLRYIPLLPYTCKRMDLMLIHITIDSTAGTNIAVHCKTISQHWRSKSWANWEFKTEMPYLVLGELWCVFCELVTGNYLWFSAAVYAHGV